MTLSEAIEIMNEYLDIHIEEEYTELVKGEVEAIKVLLEVAKKNV